jgi:hypothetical protein
METGDRLSAGIVAYVSIGAGVVAVLAGLAGWLRTRAEVAQLQRQQAQSKRMVIPPSVSDVERYSGAKARLRVLRRRTVLCFAAGGLGIATVAATVIASVTGVGGARGDGPATVVQAPPAAAQPPAAADDDVDRARRLLGSLGKLCRAERRKCNRHRKDVGPIVASVCHFHPELCAAGQLPAGLPAPSAKEQAAAPRVPHPVLQALTAKLATDTVTWDDVQLALP